MSPSSSPSLSASKLRYAAYDAPTIPKPRPRPRRRASVARSETDSLDSVLSRTMTPGELALATQELEALSLVRGCAVDKSFINMIISIVAAPTNEGTGGKRNGPLIVGTCSHKIFVRRRDRI